MPRTRGAANATHREVHACPTTTRKPASPSTGRYSRPTTTATSVATCPDQELAEAAEVAPLLHPTFDSPNTPGVPARAPDIVAGRDGLYAPDTGGTSVFDRAGVLRRADGDFVIPDGTDIPPDLKVKQDSYNKRLQATHYTIMPAKPMYREVLMGQLDNFVRNAIRRQWEKARGL